MQHDLGLGDFSTPLADLVAAATALLADADGAVAKSYGVKRAIGLLKVKRTTFVINQDRTIRAVISSEFNMNAHVDQALAALAN